MNKMHFPTALARGHVRLAIVGTLLPSASYCKMQMSDNGQQHDVLL